MTMQTNYSTSSHTKNASIEISHIEAAKNDSTYNNPLSANIHSNRLATMKGSKRWVALVSSSFVMKSTNQSVLHVKPRKCHTAFDIIERLLFSKTCAVIHITEHLSLSQIERLQHMALFSGTELVFIGSVTEFNSTQERHLA